MCNCTAVAVTTVEIMVQPFVYAVTEINKFNMFAFLKMFYDASEGFCI